MINALEIVSNGQAVAAEALAQPESPSAQKAPLAGYLAHFFADLAEESPMRRQGLSSFLKSVASNHHTRRATDVALLGYMETAFDM